MSAIRGTGWGDSHEWEIGDTAQVGNQWWLKQTVYYCKCGVQFRHFYDIDIDIFEAIKKAGIPNECPLRQMDRR